MADGAAATPLHNIDAWEIHAMLEHPEGHTRLNPPWWDRRHYVLSRLREALEQIVSEDLAITHGQRVVDIGCGSCPYRPLFATYNCTYVGCDLSGEVDLRIRVGERIDLADMCADGVVSFQVLEHVWDLDWYLGEYRRILKPGGWLLLSTHGTWLYHPDPTDYRRWTRDGLICELEKRGFQLNKICGIVGPLAWTTQFRLDGYYYLLRRIPGLGTLLLPPLTILTNVRMLLEDMLTPPAIREQNACVYLTVSRKPEEGACVAT